MFLVAVGPLFTLAWFLVSPGRVAVPLQGDEIGRLIANALEGGIVDRRPWYDPADKLPDQPIINIPLQTDYDSLVVDMPARSSSPTPLTPDHKPPRSSDKRGS